ncbi:hypothetical protein [Sporosarcina sp. YIM B06819]|nr:hypothetical protein [Sporosarcina sp. YIM B06819]
MNLGKLVKTAIKVAPIVYPIVRKILTNKKSTDVRIPKK